MSKQILLLSVAFLTFLPLAGETVKAVLFPFREAEISSRVDSTLQNCKFRIGEKFKAGDVLIEYVQKYYRTYAFPAAKGVLFGLAKLGNDAGIYGSAKMVLKD